MLKTVNKSDTICLLKKYSIIFCLPNSELITEFIVATPLYDEYSEQSIAFCEFGKHLCYAQITEALFVFYDIYVSLCKQKGVSPSKAAEENGLNRTSVVKWKSGTVPSGDTLNKLSRYFGVSMDYLLGNGQKETPTLTKEDERDIKVKIDEIIEMMEKQKGLMFDGDPLSPAALDSIRSAMELGMAAAKTKNKKKQ